MSKREDIEKRTEELLMPILESNSFDLWDVEYVKEGSDYCLRAYIDKEDGITIDDCEIVSRALSDILDEKDYIDDAYILEVSSPGLGRTLKKDKELERCLGMDVDIKTYKAVNGTKDFTGELNAYDKESITIIIDGSPVIFTRSDIAIIKLSVEW